MKNKIEMKHKSKKMKEDHYEEATDIFMTDKEEKALRALLLKIYDARKIKSQKLSYAFIWHITTRVSYVLSLHECEVRCKALFQQQKTKKK